MPTPVSLDEIPRDPIIRRAWVSFQLKIRGKSLASIADELGVKRQAISGALDAPSHRGEAALAAALDVEPQDLFPERYDTTGRRIVRTHERKASTPPASRNVEKRGAA